MSVIYKFLFPSKPDGHCYVTSDISFTNPVWCFTHVARCTEMGQLRCHVRQFSRSFRNRSQLSLVLAIFGEMVCSMAFIFGFLYRLTMIPMIFTMCIAFFVVHGSDPFAVKELAFIYLVVFILLYIAGPGKFSLDHFIAKALASHKK